MDGAGALLDAEKFISCVTGLPARAHHGSCRFFLYWLRPAFAGLLSETRSGAFFSIRRYNEYRDILLSLPRKGGGVTVSTGLDGPKRHAGVWAPVIARKTILANNNLALAA